MLILKKNNTVVHTLLADIFGDDLKKLSFIVKVFSSPAPIDTTENLIFLDLDKCDRENEPFKTFYCTITTDGLAFLPTKDVPDGMKFLKKRLFSEFLPTFQVF